MYFVMNFLFFCDVFQLFSVKHTVGGVQVKWFRILFGLEKLNSMFQVSDQKQGEMMKLIVI